MSVFEGFVFTYGTSAIHRLDPRVKLLYAFSVMILSLIFSSLLIQILLFLIQIPIVFSADVSRRWFKTMRGCLIIAIIIFASNLFARWLNSGYKLSLDFFEISLAMTFRFAALVASFSIFSLTTSPDDLSLAMEQMRIPYWFCFAFTTAIRLMPTLARDAQAIMDAQKSRGLELERGNFMKRARNYVPILVPLIVSAIRRSFELAEAMESKAWGANVKRTSMKKLRFKFTDYITLILILFFLIFGFYVKWFVEIPKFSSFIKLV